MAKACKSAGMVNLVSHPVQVEVAPSSLLAARLKGLGIALGVDYSTLAQVRDPDGNLLTLATPPSRPYPPA
jgi:hypothetical protein